MIEANLSFLPTTSSVMETRAPAYEQLYSPASPAEML